MAQLKRFHQSFSEFFSIFLQMSDMNIRTTLSESAQLKPKTVPKSLNVCTGRSCSECQNVFNLASLVQCIIYLPLYILCLIVLILDMDDAAAIESVWRV